MQEIMIPVDPDQIIFLHKFCIDVYMPLDGHHVRICPFSHAHVLSVAGFEPKTKEKNFTMEQISLGYENMQSGLVFFNFIIYFVFYITPSTFTLVI